MPVIGHKVNVLSRLPAGGALLGLAIAAVCTALSHVTGNIVWDAAGSICIGLLLGAIACFLVSKNRQLLIGRSMNPREVEVRARQGAAAACAWEGGRELHQGQSGAT